MSDWTCIFEHDADWLSLLREIFQEAGIGCVAYRGLPANREYLAGAAYMRVLIADWSLIHGGPILGDDVSRQAIDFFVGITDAGFGGVVILLSGAARLAAIKATLQGRFSILRFFTLDKGTSDWDVLVEIVRSNIPSAAGVPIPSPESGRSFVDMEASWVRLLSGEGDATGLDLENAVSDLFSTAGLNVTQRVRSVTGEMDLIVRLPGGYGAIFEPRYIIVECKNRNDPVSSSDIEVLDNKLRKSVARLGVIVSRSGITGHRKSVDRDAVRAMQDVVADSAGARVIVSINFEQCLSIARGTRSLDSVLEEAAFEQRMRRRR